MTNNKLTRNHYFPPIMGQSVLDSIFEQLIIRSPDWSGEVTKKSTEGYPLTDIYKDEENNQVIEVALAGFSKEDLRVEVRDNYITISCDSASKGDAPSRRIARRSFSKSFVDYENQLEMKRSDASFENGLLRVVIPPTEESKPTSIAIA